MTFSVAAFSGLTAAVCWPDGCDRICEGMLKIPTYASCRLSEMVVSEKVVLKRLMPPLVEALGCSETLVTLALHTLEYWVDSLNPEFLEPAMLPVIGELMRALWTHLRPVQDSQFGAKVRCLWPDS